MIARSEKNLRRPAEQGAQTQDAKIPIQSRDFGLLSASKLLLHCSYKECSAPAAAPLQSLPKY